MKMKRLARSVDSGGPSGESRDTPPTKRARVSQPEVSDEDSGSMDEMDASKLIQPSQIQSQDEREAVLKSKLMVT